MEEIKARYLVLKKEKKRKEKKRKEKECDSFTQWNTIQLLKTSTS